jgi:Leucine-rich repeat (LRR) protein
MEKLYNDLLNAYSDKNLNRITGKLIDLYKNKNYSTIRGLANKISKYIIIDEEKDAKCFSKLIMLYHPDRGAIFKNDITTLYFDKNAEGLEKYAHILLIDDIDTVKVLKLDDDIDYHPEYVWDDKQSDEYDYSDSDDIEYDVYFGNEEIEKSFYNAVKLREFGRLNLEFPTWYLQDFDTYEMANSGIDSLDGIEYCLHLVTLDVSDNQISDISNLWNLQYMEELFLANNQIGYIDTLGNLLKLRILDLSGNQIDDLSPLFELEHLEYLNLVGNKIPKHQIEKLQSKNIVVMV